jgi:preprotein translocase subunit SecE
LSTKVYRRIVLIVAVNAVFFALIVWFIATLPD